jgi:hemolysin activation/secretion protein
VQEKHILQALPALKKGSAINLKMLDNQIMAANENPSRVIAVSLQTIDVGVFDANITVTEDKMIKHSLSLDNTGNRNQDPLRIRYRFTHAGLGSQRDATGIFIYSSSPNNDIQQYPAYYNQPLSPKGDSLYLLTAYSNSATGLSQTGFGDFNVAGSGQFYSLHYARPLYRSLSAKWALDFGIEYHKSIDTTSFSGIDVGPDVNSFPFSIAAQYNWKGKVDTVSANIIYVRNISGGYLNDDETYNKVRPGASSRYQLWRGNITYLHRFKNGWIFNNRYDWQYTTQPLIPDEEIGLGGVRSIRGLEEREALGDKGVSASFELYTPPLGHGIRLLAFYDIGQFWSFNFPYNNLIGPTTISSTGIGIRWTINRRLAFNADYAYVIKGYGTTPTHGTRIHFDLTATF